MTEYAFYTAQLRFVANKTPRDDAEVAAMMSSLQNIAEQIDAGAKKFHVAAKDLRIAARALAGVAGFLQQHILPEAVAAGNTAGEAQLRWSIDNSMAMMAQLTTHAELTKDKEDLDVTLPSPPGS